MLAAVEPMLAAVPDALALGFAAMSFDREAFVRVAEDPGARNLALLVLYFAGGSQGLGHGVVLFLNRVPPRRFLLSLALMAAIFLASVVVVAATSLLLADVAFRRELAFLPTIAVLSLAHAPRLLGFLTLAPYFGELFDRILGVWVLMLTLFGLSVGIGLPVYGAALLALLGWVMARALSLAFGRPLTMLSNAAKRLAAGAPLTLNAQNLVEALKQQAREAAARRRDRDK